MGRTANLSPLGLFGWDDSIFDLFVIPSALDKQVLIDNLLEQTAELEVLYPNPVVFKNLVGVWSKKNLDVWTRLWKTTQYDYNPIENYNRYETGSENGSQNSTTSGNDTRSGVVSQSGADTTTGSKAEGGSETTNIDTAYTGYDTVEGTTHGEHWIAGYDSAPSGDDDDGLVKQTRDEGTTSSTTTYNSNEDKDYTTTFGKTERNNSTTTYGKTDTTQDTMIYGKKSETSNNGEHNLHAHGNIGVTTTQKLIREQREIDLFNLYDIIIEDFKMKFCILIY